MQTFLPYERFHESAKCLDNKRLQKQIVECKQIYLALILPEYGWKNHPAVKMWQRFEECLIQYALSCIEEWELRHKKIHVLNEYFSTCPFLSHLEVPSWIGNPEFHLSHQSNLYRKDPEHYKQFADIGPNLPYYWPTKHGY